MDSRRRNRRTAVPGLRKRRKGLLPADQDLPDHASGGDQERNSRARSMGGDELVRSAVSFAARIQVFYGAAATVQLRPGPLVSRRGEKVFRQRPRLPGV